DLRPGDLVQQGRLPAAEREPHRVLVGAAGRLSDEVEGCEQLDVDEAHALLPMSWLSRSEGRPVGAGRLIAATAPSSVLADPRRAGRAAGPEPGRGRAVAEGRAGRADFLDHAQVVELAAAAEPHGVQRPGPRGNEAAGGRRA